MLVNISSLINPMKSVLTLNSLEINHNLALILTASIDIKGMPKATPTIPEQRQEEYFNSLKYYVNNHPLIRKIIFIENSGWDLSRVREAARNNPHRKEIELISLNCNDFPRRYGKGFGECLLIEKGLEQSTILPTVTHFAKITGRIYLENLTKLVLSIDRPFDCFCDYKDRGYKIRKLWGEKHVGPHCDTRFLIFSTKFYQEHIKPLHIKHQQKELRGFCIEAEFYQAIKQRETQSRVISRLTIEPKFSGVAGHFGGKNYDSILEKTKYQIRSFNRFAVPWLHF
jgi:hypothetical protein